MVHVVTSEQESHVLNPHIQFRFHRKIKATNQAVSVAQVQLFFMENIPHLSTFINFSTANRNEMYI